MLLEDQESLGLGSAVALPKILFCSLAANHYNWNNKKATTGFLRWLLEIGKSNNYAL